VYEDSKDMFERMDIPIEKVVRVVTHGASGMAEGNSRILADYQQRE
jgi:hypothetical protein